MTFKASTPLVSFRPNGTDFHDPQSMAVLQPCPLCLRGLAQGVEQTQHFWHEPFFNLGDANTVSSRPGLWVPVKLFWDRYAPVRTQSPGTMH